MRSLSLELLRLRARTPARRVLEIIVHLVEVDEGRIGESIVRLQIIRHRGGIGARTGVARHLDLARRRRLAVEQNVAGYADSDNSRLAADAVLIRRCRAEDVTDLQASHGGVGGQSPDDAVAVT